MSEEIDIKEARSVMAEAVAVANELDSRQDMTFVSWEQRLDAFSRLVADIGYTTSIALVGSALIAKSTNNRIDTMSLQSKDSTPGAYSARRPAEQVLYPASLLHGFDIGSSSRNPLNGQTFNKLKRIDLTLRIKGKGQQLVKPLVELLREISLLPDRTHGVKALAAYVHVRRRYVRVYAPPVGQARLSTVKQLVQAITELVARASEGGGRAQAVVGALLEVMYGRERVRLGKPNEPDRKIVGDVIVRESALLPSSVIRAIEVRDKEVSYVDVLAVIQKFGRSGMLKGAIVAVDPAQRTLHTTYQAAAQSSGIQLEVFEGWPRFVREVIFWCDRSETDAVGEAIGAVRQRLIDIGMSNAAVEDWDSLTLERPDDG